MKTTYTERRDGTAVIEIICEAHENPTDCRATLWADRGVDGITERWMEVGDEGVLVTKERVFRPLGIVDCRLVADDEGIGGNMDASKRSMHGWRGTDNDVATFAHGWRRVTDIAPRKRGLGWRITLSPDLRPDHD